MLELPAVLGGAPAFDRPVPLTRPTLRSDDEVARSMRAVLESGMTTNATEVAALERETADYLGTAHVVAVSSCTTGLILLLRALGVRGEVVLPSFTFMASGHAVRWNGTRERFADIDPENWTLDRRSAERAFGSNTGAVMAVHTFGAPCRVEELEQLCADRGVPLIFDAAHGFGGRYADGTMIGAHGAAEVFSLSPTKPFSAGEGGLIATSDDDLAAELRLAREYGNPGDYDSRFAGLNGRMPELSAVVGRAALRDFPDWMQRRRGLAQRYADRLAGIPGIALQRRPEGALSAHKDLSLRVDATAFGLTRDQLSRCLAAEHVTVRHYFDPPLHRQTAYQPAGAETDLPVTDDLSGRILTLPLYSHMKESVVDRISAVVEHLHTWAGSVGDMLDGDRRRPATTLT